MHAVWIWCDLHLIIVHSEAKEQAAYSTTRDQNKEKTVKY